MRIAVARKINTVLKIAWLTKIINRAIPKWKKRSKNNKTTTHLYSDHEKKILYFHIMLGKVDGKKARSHPRACWFNTRGKDLAFNGVQLEETA